jgi:hypothetical protein
MADSQTTDDWQEWWDARVAAMEAVLGPTEPDVLHAVVPFQFGFEAGGAADVIFFKKHIPGVVWVTCELIGLDEQVTNEIGNYELMVCHRDEDEWGSDIISRLAYYTLDAKLNPGHTMDLGPSAPEGSTITAFLFLEYARFKVRSRDAGLLLCMGITADELKRCRMGRREEVVHALKEAGVYPYTDLFRQSSLKSRRF